MRILNDNPLKTNCYTLCGHEEALIVDPSGQAAEALAYAVSCGAKRITLAYTHGHFDHIAYGKELAAACKEQGLPLKSFAGALEKNYFGEAGQTRLQRALEMFSLDQLYLGAQAPDIDIFLQDSQPVEFEDFIFIETPGHSPGSGIYYSQQRGLMFTGDTIFAYGGIGRCDFEDSNPLHLEQSIQKLLKFSDETQIFPGHGRSGQIGFERRFYD